MLGVGASRDKGRTWEPTFEFLSYEIANFTFHPHRAGEVWVGTMSGPHVSTDGGLHWEPRCGGLPERSDRSYSSPIQQILFDPADDRRLLAFGGSWRGWAAPAGSRFGWIWESLDAGKTWHEHGIVKRFRNIRWAAAAAGSLNTIFVSVQSEGLFKSDDGGRTWAGISGLPSTQISQIATHPTDPDILWVSMNRYQPAGAADFQPGGIWKSCDGGKSWKACNRGLPQKSNGNQNFASSFGPLTVSASQPQILYTSDAAWDAPAVYRSEDGGESWRAIFTNETHKLTQTAYPAGIGATVITVDPHDPDTVYCAGSESVIMSGDGGKTWCDLTADREGEGPFWRGRGYSGLCSVAVRFNPKNPNMAAIIAMDAGRLWISEDNQRTWRRSEEGLGSSWGGGRDLAFAGSDGKILLGALGQQGGSGNVGLSNDGGRTWKVLGQPGSGLPPSGKGEASAAYLLPDDPDKMWVVYDGKLYHSKDRGRNWTALIDGQYASIVSDPKEPRRFYVTGVNGLKYTDTGEDFTDVVGSPQPVSALAIDHQHPEVLYATRGYNNGGGIFKYDGQLWTKIFDNPLVSGLAIDPTDGSRIIASTNRDPYRDVCDATGAWMSEDGGKTWSNQKEGLACLRGWNVAINPHDPEQVFYCSQGRGFFVARWPKSNKGK